MSQSSNTTNAAQNNVSSINEQLANMSIEMKNMPTMTYEEYRRWGIGYRNLKLQQTLQGGIPDAPPLAPKEKSQTTKEKNKEEVEEDWEMVAEAEDGDSEKVTKEEADDRQEQSGSRTGLKVFAMAFGL